MIDPGLKADIHADKPWTMSPLLCAMNIFNVSQPPGSSVGAVLPSTETSKDGHARGSIAPSPINSPTSDDTLRNEALVNDLDQKLKITVDSSVPDMPEWTYNDGNCLEEQNTLFVNGKPMASEARKVPMMNRVLNF